MPEPNTCDVRVVTAPDGVSIPVPVGGVGLADGSMVIINDDAEVQILINTNSDGQTLGYYVVVNNSKDSDSEATRLFGELSVETAITTLEHLATEAFAAAGSILIKAAGLLAGVLVSVFTSSHLTNEVFIRGSLETGNSTDGPPITYCLLV
jgi:hypothetical protein